MFTTNKMDNHQRLRVMEVINSIWNIGQELDRTRKDIDLHVSELKDLIEENKDQKSHDG